MRFERRSLFWAKRLTMARLNEVVKKFHTLSKDEQNDLLRELYNYSKDIKLFLESKLCLQYDADYLINAMEKETIGKVYRKGRPATPNGNKVNAIISKAKKASISTKTILELEQLAYRGFIEFLNEYGGGPENFDEMACNHLEEYLRLIKTKIKDVNERKRRYEEVKKYLLKLNNMMTDSIDETYEHVTGEEINRESRW